MDNNSDNGNNGNNRRKIMDEKTGAMLSELKIVTPVARASFPHIFEMTENMNGKLKYSIGLIFDKDCDFSVFKKAANHLIKKKWRDGLPEKFRFPIRNGSSERSKYPEYRDKYFINCSTSRRPKIGEKIDGVFYPIEDPERIYPGVYVRCSLSAYAYSKKGNEGIGFSLNHVMFVRNGTRFDTQTDPDEDFGGFSDSETGGTVTDPESESMGHGYPDPGYPDPGYDGDDDIPFNVDGPQKNSGDDLFL